MKRGYIQESINKGIKPTKFGMFAYLKKLQKEVHMATDSVINSQIDVESARPLTSKTRFSGMDSF